MRRVIEAVDLTSVSGKRVRALSGGMRRSAALAASLLGDPQFLVLDEPTAGLDPEQRLRFRELVSRAGEGRAVLLSTHQTEDVAALCQDVVVLGQRTGALPGHAVRADRRGATAGSGSPTERSGGAELVWRTGEGRFRHLGTPPPGADLVEPTLEDGYLLLVGRFDEEAAA